jgi:hypothetical protein
MRRLTASTARADVVHYHPLSLAVQRQDHNLLGLVRPFPTEFPH